MSAEPAAENIKEEYESEAFITEEAKLNTGIQSDDENEKNENDQ